MVGLGFRAGGAMKSKFFRNLFTNSSTDDEQHQRRYGPSAEEQLDGLSAEFWSIK